MKAVCRCRAKLVAAKPSPLHQRHLSTSSPPPPPPLKGFARLTTRRLISIRGHDAPHFLQGLTTRNVTPSTRNGFYSAFLNASGRVLHDVFIYPDRRSDAQDTPAFLIEVDAQEVQALARHLKRYKLRAKVTADVVDEGEAQVWSAWGDTSSGKPTGDDSWAVCEDGRAEGMGTRLILPGGKKPELDGDMVEAGTYEIKRMLNGVAEGQAEIVKEAALPLESNMDYMGGVDFRKGCYVGQELTIRTQHTGVVRKRILPVQLYHSENAPETLEYDPQSQFVLPPRDTNIKRLDGQGRSTGKWLGGLGNIGLALCRLENMTDIVLTGERNQWNPKDEFVISWPAGESRESGNIKVRAFVPDWHRIRISASDTQRDGNTSTS